jgi:hypothetical protein
MQSQRIEGPIVEVKPVPGSLRRIAAALIVVAGICLVAGIYASSLTAKSAAERDYIEFWAAGQQLVHHQNPYDVAAIYRMEREQGMEGVPPRLSYSPPVGFFFMLPLGLVSAKTGLVAWLLAELGAVALAAWLLWRLHGRPDSRWHLLAFAFAPCVACLMAGQLGNFFLLFLALFLTLARNYRFWAGVALMPFAMKPHLFLPFALAMLAWIVLRRAWRVAAGFAAALAASCGLAMWFDPRVWTHYREMMAVTGVLNAFVPALSVALRFAVVREHAWVQFVPEAACCAWAVWWFWRRRERWEWARDGMVVLLVSSVCTAYGWFSDEPVLFPALLGAVYAGRLDRRLIPMAIAAAAALAETLAGVRMNTPYFLWTTPAWLLTYLYAVWKARAGEEKVDHIAAGMD